MADTGLPRVRTVRQAEATPLHADAHTISVIVRVEDELTVEVVDDGCGMPADVTPSGLNNLRNRAAEIGGSLSLTEASDGGTVVRWSAPLN